ncbi:putative serpin-Z5 [Lolium rigidum]|uniref:putative serpin-Z5 n=1 Tax=Lolium rigidum TaxID=89674 RepID=UPI001F5D4357|nr:putative serpin-Z5 [Lolium rigidum]
MARRSPSAARLPKLCRSISTEAAAADLPARSPSCRSGQQAFALALNKRLADDAARRNANLIFSPAALSLVTAGARERTLSKLLGVLGAPSRDDLARSVRVLTEQSLADQSQRAGPRINFSCSVWHDRTRTLKPAYIDAAAKSYKAQTGALDFHDKPEEAATQINAWAAASTNNLIDKIIDASRLSDLTDLMVANAVYFKGKWKEPFDKKKTKDDKFYRLDDNTVNVPFMRDSRRQHIACHDGFKVLQLRLRRGGGGPPRGIYSMCVFLPDARDGLAQLTDKISRDPDFVGKHLPTETVRVGEFRLPKFKLDLSASLNGVLRDLGINEAFRLEKADFSDMVEDNGHGISLSLEEISHRAIIEMNEEGTEATAATSLGMRGRPIQKSVPVFVDFVADHPFAFFVMEKLSGAIMFAGHVLDPSTSLMKRHKIDDQA